MPLLVLSLPGQTVIFWVLRLVCNFRCATVPPFFGLSKSSCQWRVLIRTSASRFCRRSAYDRAPFFSPARPSLVFGVFGMARAQRGRSSMSPFSLQVSGEGRMRSLAAIAVGLLLVAVVRTTLPPSIHIVAALSRVHWGCR